ncbi:UxaA family hydrolase [Dryocola clanedunensis]
MEQVVYKINQADNVATALTPVSPGLAQLRGAAVATVEAHEAIKMGHKIALLPIPCGAQIIKYGISIGCATRDIRQGDWVHLHVMRSNYDERSSHLDVVTGAPKDVKYE